MLNAINNLCILLLLTNNLITAQLCSNDGEYKCACVERTDENSNLPMTIADCSASLIDNIPDQLEDSINHLDLSLNNIVALDPKERKLSSTNLNTLILSYNKIKDVNDEFFLNVPNLRELDLSNNDISSLQDGDIFQNLNKLVRLDLSYNNLKTLPTGIFDPVTNLRFIDLSYNPMGNFLSGSKDVWSKVLGVNSNLTHLVMNNVGVTDLHNAYFDSFVDIRYLSLADNGFKTIPTVPYSVEYLDLSGNNLSFISAKYLNYHSLKVLKLNRMPSLTSVHHYAFYNLNALEKLSITDCPNLKEFSDLAFDVASRNEKLHPKILSLARNGLISLNETYKYFFKNMEIVDLRHNSWNCDCKILWLNEFRSTLYKPHDIKCKSPDDLKYKNVLDLKPADLKECYPEIYGKKSHRAAIAILITAVVLLCCLIFYLVRYPSSWLGHSAVGPSSPYSRTPSNEGI